MSPKIYVDGDACPVKEDIYRVARRYQLKVLMCCRSEIRVPPDVELVVAGEGFDAVDDLIEARIAVNDIAVTNDLLLASRCIKKGARVLDPRGKILDEDNIGEALATRELMYQLRQMGAMDLGPKGMKSKHRSNFLANLDKLINQSKAAKVK